MTYFAASSPHLHVLGGSPAVNRHLGPQRRWTAWEISPHTSQYTLLKLQSRNNNINSNNFKYQDFKSQKHTFFTVLANFKQLLLTHQMSYDGRRRSLEILQHCGKSPMVACARATFLFLPCLLACLRPELKLWSRLKTIYKPRRR